MNLKDDIRGIKIRTWFQFIAIVTGIISFAILSSLIRIRLDLTEDKRYTLSTPAKKVLDNIRNDIFIQVYLDGEMPIPFKRLKRSVREMLDEFRVASRRKVDYVFLNPSESDDPERRSTFYKTLIGKGLLPVNIQAGDQEGGSSQKIIFPGMIVNYNGIEVPVNFLKNNPGVTAEENLLHSIEGLEYEMIQTISTLSSDTIYKVAFLEGHDEIQEEGVADITLNLAKFFTIDRGRPGGIPGVLDDYAAVVVAGPEREFSEEDKYVLDQYIMRGGKVMWLIEEVKINADSLVFGETAAIYRPLNIEDLLFRYGARINPVTVQDVECMNIRLTMMVNGVRQQVVPAPWFYYPLLLPSDNHPITRNINRVKGEFINYIDTVGLDKSVKKTVLLSTSRFSKIVSPPFMISLKEAEITPDGKDFTSSSLPVAVLLEGKFTSVFRNRLTGHFQKTTDYKTRTESLPTRMIVIADGDIIRNEVRRQGQEVFPYPLGQDKYTGEMYGNRDFLVNSLNYLIDDNGITNLRSRELKLRLLDKAKIKKERIKWQVINLAGPVLVVILAGLIYAYFRRRKYTDN